MAAGLRLKLNSEELVVRVLQESAPGPNPTLIAAGIEANLLTTVMIDRASVAFLNFSRFNLCDDLSDGECTYLPEGQAPVVLLLLSDVFFRELGELGLPHPLVGEIVADLVAAEQAQLEEIETETWDAAKLRRVTDGIAGRQWAAYLRLLWYGTELESRAADVALTMARFALIAGDVGSEDNRYRSLSLADKQITLLGAQEAIERALSLRLKFIDEIVEETRPILESELTRISHQ